MHERKQRYSPTARRHVTIIGAGIGGLSAAIRLARAGVPVTVIEKHHAPGGRCGKVEASGFTWDLGPTILLVPRVLRELFEHAGRRLEDYLDVQAVDPNYRIHYADGSTLLLERSRANMRRELDRLEPGAGARYDDFLDAGNAQMTAAMDRFAVTHYGSVRSFATPAVLRDLYRARAHRTLASHVGGFFDDARLRMAFSFQTMYLGLSPYEAPALFGLLPYTELADGIYYTRGGLAAIPVALERLARELGVRFEYGREVTRLCPRGNDRIGWIELDGGRERRTCDVVLANADLAWVYERLLPEGRLARTRPLRFTSSALVLHIGLDRRYPDLLHHNVFFGARYRESFAEIFGAKVIPADPSFYVAVPSETDPSVAPAGASAMYVLIPVPHQSERVDWSRAEQPLRERVLAKLEATVAPGLRKHIVVEKRMNPDGWNGTLNLVNGSAFGLAHSLDQVGPFRPRNRHAAYANLYFCGASTQPGTGIPLVAISGKLAAERILDEQCRGAWPIAPVARGAVAVERPQVEAGA